MCGPMTQRLISALLEENIVTSLQDTMESEGQGMYSSVFFCYKNNRILSRDFNLS